MHFKRNNELNICPIELFIHRIIRHMNKAQKQLHLQTRKLNG